MLYLDGESGNSIMLFQEIRAGQHRDHIPPSPR
jgi:hypothetical protein